MSAKGVKVASEVASLVYSYLLTVDKEVANAFQQKTKAKQSATGSPSINEVLVHSSALQPQSPIIDSSKSNQRVKHLSESVHRSNYKLLKPAQTISKDLKHVSVKANAAEEQKSSSDSSTSSDDNDNDKTQKKISQPQESQVKITTSKKQESSSDSDSSNSLNAPKSFEKSLPKMHTAKPKIAGNKKITSELSHDEKPETKTESESNQGSESDSSSNDSTQFIHKIISKLMTDSPKITQNKQQESNKYSESSSNKELSKLTQGSNLNPKETYTKITPATNQDKSSDESDSSSDEPTRNVASDKITLSKHQESTDDSDSSNDSSKPANKRTLESKVASAKITLTKNKESGEDSDSSSDAVPSKPQLKPPTKLKTSSVKMTPTKKQKSSKDSESSSDEERSKPGQRRPLEHEVASAKITPTKKQKCSDSSDKRISTSKIPKKSKITPVQSTDSSDLSSDEESSKAVKGSALEPKVSAKITPTEKQESGGDSDSSSDEEPSQPQLKIPLNKRKATSVKITPTKNNESGEVSDTSSNEGTYIPKVPLTAPAKMAPTKKRVSKNYSDSSSEEELSKPSRKSTSDPKAVSDKITPTKKQESSEVSDSSSSPKEHKGAQGSFKVTPLSRKITFEENNNSSNDETHPKLSKTIQSPEAKSQKDEDVPTSPMSQGKTSKSSKKTTTKKKESSEASDSSSNEKTYTPKVPLKAMTAPAKRSSTNKRVSKKYSDSSSEEELSKPSRKSTSKPKVVSDKITPTKKQESSEVSDSSSSPKEHKGTQGSFKVTPLNRKITFEENNNSSNDETRPKLHKTIRSPEVKSQRNDDVSTSPLRRRKTSKSSSGSTKLRKSSDATDGPALDPLKRLDQEEENIHSDGREKEPKGSGQPTTIKLKGEKTHKCSICEKTLSSSTSLKRHSLIHTRADSESRGRRAETSAERDRSRVSRSEVSEDETFGDDKKPLSDAIGGENSDYSSEDKVKDEGKKHSQLSESPKPKKPADDRSYKCSICEKTLSSSSNLNRHIKIHTRRDSENRSPVANEMKLSVHSEDSEDHFKEDKKKISKMKSLKCEVCEKQLATPASLKRHSKIHTRQEMGRDESNVPSDNHYTADTSAVELARKESGNASGLEENLLNDSTEVDHKVKRKKSRKEEKQSQSKEKQKNRNVINESNNTEERRDDDKEQTHYQANQESRLTLNKQETEKKVRKNKKNNEEIKDVDQGKDKKNNHVKTSKQHKSVTSENVLQCEVCEKQFSTISDLGRHLKVHTNASDVEGLATSDKNYSEVSDTNINVVEAKTKLFKEENNFSPSDMDNIFMCLLCNTRYATVAALKRHAQTHPRRRKPNKKQSAGSHSDVSERSLHDQSQIDTNKTPTMKKSTQKSYKCLTCGKELATSSKLKQHLQTHTSEAESRKGENSEYSSSDVNQKTTPEQDRVTGDTKSQSKDGSGKNFKCLVCERQLATTSSLKRHSKIHTRLQNEPTAEETVENVNTELTSKARKEEGINPFECSVCKEVFSTTSNLKRHIKSHGDEDEPSIETKKKQKKHKRDKKHSSPEGSPSKKGKTKIA